VRLLPPGENPTAVRNNNNNIKFRNYQLRSTCNLSFVHFTSFVKSRKILHFYLEFCFCTNEHLMMMMMMMMMMMIGLIPVAFDKQQ
jgi:hypothetical protein